AKWCSFVLGFSGVDDGSRVVMEMGEWSGRKSYTVFGWEKVHG
nr:hypothetical protein [Tanacetum cinerariifolium]